MYYEKFNKKLDNCGTAEKRHKNQILRGGNVMKNKIYIIGVMLVTLVLGFSANTVMAEDPVMAESANPKVLLDNDRVRVFETNRPPGTVVPMHTHPPYLAYIISTFSAKFTSADGKVKEKTLPAGKLLWSPNGKTHALEITGTNNQRVIAVELK